jgi:hypothetical protein
VHVYENVIMKSIIIIIMWQYWGLKARPCACYRGALPLDICP